MLQSYVPILILLAISVVNAVGMIVASHFLGPLRPTATKSSPYESVMIPLGSTRERFSVKFYLVAILFIVFDLEAAFLFPWAVSLDLTGWPGWITMMVFLFELAVGLAYAWKKGALDWE